MVKNISVLLVDDHPVVRSGYRRLLDSCPDIEVTGEADDGEVACRVYTEKQPDVVVMDINMPHVNGVEAARRIVDSDPDARILVFTMYDNPAMMAQAMAAGILGYLTKRSSVDILTDAIRKVAAGKMAIDPDLAATLIPQRRSRGIKDPVAKLTPRESEVFRLLAEGRSVGEIALLLGISDKTVGVHQTRIMHKLGTRNVVQLVHLAIRQGVIQI